MIVKPLELLFDTKGNEKQKLAARYWNDDETEEICYGGAKYGGKSYLGCSLIFGDALTYPETNYFIARETLADLYKFTAPSISEVFKGWGIEMSKFARYNGQHHFYTLYNGSKVFFLEAKYYPSDPDFQRFGSTQMTRGWAEEIGEMAGLAIINLGLTIGRWNNEKYNLKAKFLQTCNPHKGYGYRTFYKPAQKGELEKRRKFIQAFPQDNKAGSKAYIESLKNNPDRNTRERLYFGNWEYDDDPDTMMNIDAINDLFTNTLEQNPNEKYLIVDAARFGNDNIVFSFWKGYDWYKVVYKNKQPLNETEEDIRDFAAKENIPYSHILIDEDGIGGGIVDHLQGVKGFIANRTPTLDPATGRPQNFRNIKSQCAFLLASKVNGHLVRFSFNDEKAREMVVADLEQYKVKNPDRDGKKQIISKDEMKEHLGRSPDFGDCALMRMWFEIKNIVTAKPYEQPPYQPTSEYEDDGKYSAPLTPNRLAGVYDQPEYEGQTF